MATAQYVIDIAANMPSGEQTIAQLDQLTAKLQGGGKGADFFSSAISKVSDQLTGAKAASAAANAALAEGERTFASLERAAVQATKAEEKAALAGKLDPSVSRTAHEARTAVEAYTGTLKKLEAEAGAAAKKEDELAKTLTNVQKLSGHTDKSLAAQAESTEKLRGALASVPGPVGKIGSSLLAPVQGFQKLSASMGEGNATMLLTATAAAGVVVALVALAAAAIVGTAAILKWSIGLADVNRAAALHQSAVIATNADVALLSGAYEQITADTGQSADALNGLVKQLRAAKVSVADMPAALRAAALAETALGQGGSADFIERIKEGKVAVRDLASETQSKLGGIVAKRMLGLDAQGARLKKNIGDIFGGLNIEPVLNGLQTLGDLFDKNTAAGQAMKFLFESVFQPIIDQAQNAAYVVEAFALGFLIGLTKLYIALKPAIKAVSDFFGFDDTSLSDVLAIATKAGEYAAYIFAGFVAALVLVAGVIAAVVVPLIAMQLAIYGMIAAIVAGVVYVDGLFIDAFEAVWTFLSGLPGKMLQMGTDLIMGLVNGISGAAGAVVDAVTGAVGGAIDAAKKKLGIASPSKVFTEIGGYTGEGMALGVEDSTADVHDAFEQMMTPPDAPTSALAAQDIGGGSGLFSGAASPGGAQATDQKQAAQKGKASVDLSGARFEFNGVKDAEHAVSMLEEALTRIIEGDAASLGGEPAPA